MTGGRQSSRRLVAQKRGLESLLLVIAHARLTVDVLQRCRQLILSRGRWQRAGAVQGHPSVVALPVALSEGVCRPGRHEVIEHISELPLCTEDILAKLDSVFCDELLLEVANAVALVQAFLAVVEEIQSHFLPSFH